MPTMKKSVQILVVIFLSMLFVLSAATMVLSMISLDKANKIDRFYSTVSSEYRRITGNDRPQDIAQTQPPSDEAPGVECTDPALFDLADEPAKGDPNSLVTIVEYSDFQCPFCARFAQTSYPQLVTDYIDTGKARLVYKDFPLERSHPLAFSTSVAANCIHRTLGETQFFAYHDLVYERQPELSSQNIRDWAISTGLSEEQYAACEDSEELEAEIRADLQEGSRFGVTGTPTFFINGQKVVGAQPFSVFQQIIDRELTSGSICGG